MEERRAKAYPVPGGIFTPSISTRIFQHGAQALPKRQLTQSLRGEYEPAHSSRALRSSRPLSHDSTSRLWRGSSGKMQEIAGSGHGPGPTLKSDKYCHLPQLVLLSRKERRSPAPRIDNGDRKWPFAEHVLRSTLSSVSPRRWSGKSWASSRTSKLFVRHPPDTDAPSVTNNSFEDICVAELRPKEHKIQTQGESDSAKPPLAPCAGKASFHSGESGVLDTDALPALRLNQGYGNMLLDLDQSLPKDAVGEIDTPDLPVQSLSSSPAEDSLNQRSTPIYQQLSISAPIANGEQEPRSRVDMEMMMLLADVFNARHSPLCL
jgi:hypothetical protein